MSDLRIAAQQALEVMQTNAYAVANEAPHRDVMAYYEAIAGLADALEQPEQEPRSRWQWMCRVLICLGTGNTSATRRAIVRAAAIGRSMK